LEIFKAMTPQQRLRRGFALFVMMKHLNATGVRIRHPDYLEDEVQLTVVRMRLGHKLFLKVYPHASHILP
jgi:hypothetical protein